MGADAVYQFIKIWFFIAQYRDYAIAAGDILAALLFIIIIFEREQIALIGESGSGKSTLLDMLAFVLQPSSAGAFRFRPGDDGNPKNIW